MEVKITTQSGLCPEYATQGSAGMDLRAYLSESLVLQPGKRALIPTGIAIQLPEGYEAQIRGRSGLAVRHGIGLVNGIGTIDSDYRGEIKVALINWGEEPVEIQNGDRVAQLVIARYERVEWLCTEELDASERGQGGFGHTGNR